MPTYSYRCTACENEFDIRQSFSDDPLTVCEECGGKLRKLFNSVGIIFKGSGFYRTDSKSSANLSAKNSAKSSGGSASPSASSSKTTAPVASVPGRSA
ncbi:MAG: zinc ribbon domain-containing protein [Ancrocorticia sp.]